MISIICDSCGTTFPAPIRCRDDDPVPEVPGAQWCAGSDARGDGAKSGYRRGRTGESADAPAPGDVPARPLLFLLMFIAALGGIIGGAYFLISQPNNTYATICAVIALAGLGSIAVWKVHTMGSSLEVTTKRSIQYRGFFGKYSNEVRHEDVRNIQISQTLLSRVFSVGNIDISSSGLEGIEITAKDIPHPYKVRDAIDAHRKL